MRRLLPALALLAALPSAVPSTAQLNATAIRVSRAVPLRAVYVAVLDVIEESGYVPGTRFLDEGIVSLPAFHTRNPGAEDTAPVVGVQMREVGDSTRVDVLVRMMRGSGKVVDSSDEGTRARRVAAQAAVAAALDSALHALPADSGGPDPREESEVYGYGRRNPVRVGGGPENGVAEEHRYLDRLRGPAGERVRYRRLGSCCEFPTKHGRQGGGMLDAYELTYDGLARPLVIYVDMYTPLTSTPGTPEGFTFAVDPPAT